jgi:4-amino-4-deoxy-L-arabinose transferase-like glycosyltransferase
MSVGTRDQPFTTARTNTARSRVSAPPAVWALVGLVLIGALLRFVTLSTQSYWFDEAQAAHELSLSFGAMVSSMISHESNPPLYFVLGWLWAKVFGTGAFGLRSLSAVAGTAVIVITYLCGRELVSTRAGLVAAALATVSPFMIWYSQEAREYMLLAAFCGASVLFFARALKRPSRRELGLWALFSALAILTHSFAGFLIAPEAAALLYVLRSRASAVAVAAVAIVQAALLPLILGHASNSLLSFITSTPLHIRIEQVPVAFGFGALYQTSLVNYGLLGAAALAAALILLVVAGAPPDQLRGAAIAAGLAAVVLVAPLLLALAGVDYYIYRALMPAWIPLAVVIGAACTAPRLRLPGAALAVVLLGSFIWAQVKIQSDTQYQRADWRGVTAALGRVSGPRAILVDDGLGTDPLRIYLPRVPWTGPAGVVTVDEVDVVGNPYQVRANPLPAGARMIGRRVVDGFLVDRFAVSPAWQGSIDEIEARAQQLLTPASPGAAVLYQRAVS